MPTAALDMFGTVRLRAGAVSGNALVYLTGGLAFARIANSAYDDVTVSASGWRHGLVGGAGVEVAISPKASVKIEALAASFAASGANGGYAYDFKDCVVVGRAGLNFRF
jgi:outer membrane immunogenic protein